MKKSQLLLALKTEIARHNLSTFMDEKEHIILLGCSTCKKHFGTTQQLMRHTTDDVLPPLIEALSTEK